jgi:hypothetical protein
MMPSVEQIVRDYERASKALRKKYNTPAKARAFLLKAGFLEKHSGSKNGVRTAKPYHS